MANFIHEKSKFHGIKTVYLHHKTKKHFLTIDEKTGKRKGNLEGYVSFGVDFHYLLPGGITLVFVKPRKEFNNETD